jgi:hypothetical protein
MVLVILFSSCIFKSALNEFGALKKHPWHIMMAPVDKIAGAKLAMGLATRSLQNLKKQHIPKSSFKTSVQNISKAAGGNGNQVSRVTNLPAAFSCRTPF